MKRISFILPLFAAGLTLAVLPGCDDKKGLEKTGENIDNMLDTKGHPVERAGEEADEALQNKNDKVDDAFDDARKKVGPNQ